MRCTPVSDTASTLRRMPDSTIPTSLAANASAVILGLCAALPAAGMTTLLAAMTRCLSATGCTTSTIIDTAIPVVTLTVWAGATAAAATFDIPARVTQHCTTTPKIGDQPCP